MKRLYESIAVVMLGALFAANGFAVEPPPEQEQKQSPMKGKGMGPMAGMSKEQKEQHMRARQEEMLKMHDLMNKILAAKDPKERERLKEEHLTLMKAHMKKMMAHHMMMKKHMQKMKQESPKQKGE